VSTAFAVQARLTALAWLATVSTSIALFPLFQQKGYLFAGAAVCAVVAGVGLGLRALRLPFLVVALGQLAAVVMWVVATQAGGEALYGVLPTPDAIAAVSEQLRSGVLAAREYAAPVPSSAGLVLLVSLGIAGIAILVDLIAVGLNRVAWAGLPLLALYTVPATTVPNGVPALAFIPGAFGFVALLSAEEGERVSHWGKRITRAGRSWDNAGKERVYTSGLAQTGRRIGTTAIALAVGIPVLLPAFSEGLWSGGAGTGEGSGSISISNPIVDLRRDLVRPADSDLITVNTTTAEVSYLRLAALDQFDGLSWRPSVRDIPSGQQASAGLPRPPGLSTSVETARKHYRISVSSKVRSSWLPEYYPTITARIRGDWRYDRDAFDILSADPQVSAAGANYSLTSLQVRPTSQQLQDAGAAPPAMLREYTALPDSVPAAVHQQALLVTGEAQTDFEQAISLQNWFRSSGGFTYSTKQAAGNSSRALASFVLRERTGYCEQFAAAMAVLARSLNIPARVAVGFLHPEQAGKGRYVFSSHDLHTWPELYFQGVGWVRFEPTPSSRTGSVPAYTSGVAVETLPETPRTVPGGTDRAPSELTNRNREEIVAPNLGGPSTLATDTATPWLGVGLVALLVLALPALARLAVRAWRWRRPSGATGQAEAAWAELRDGARDLGLPWHASRTPRASARELQPRLTADPAALAALDTLVAFVERSRYARTAGEEPNARAAVSTVRAALARGADRATRVRAVLLPASLLPDITSAWTQLQAKSRSRSTGVGRGPGGPELVDGG
jgi:transglutaminase-like putative cysteine protease